MRLRYTVQPKSLWNPAMTDQLKILAYILAKNEEANIGKCLRSLEPLNIPVVLLDSGSLDRTKEIAKRFSFCHIQDYKYIDHATAYNQLTTDAPRDTPVMILDADMEISEPLWIELKTLINGPEWEVIAAPVLMFIEGLPLRFGALYPPKAFIFRGGREYFTPKGHGEALQGSVKVTRTHNRLWHNDLKPYDAYLMSQVRYAQNLGRRFRAGQVSFKDWLRATTPLMALVFPAVSLFLRGGILAGRRGILYALDRAIAAMIQYRVVLAARLAGQSRGREESPTDC